MGACKTKSCAHPKLCVHTTCGKTWLTFIVCGIGALGTCVCLWLSIQISCGGAGLCPFCRRDHRQPNPRPRIEPGPLARHVGARTTTRMWPTRAVASFWFKAMMMFSLQRRPREQCVGIGCACAHVWGVGFGQIKNTLGFRAIVWLASLPSGL